MATAIRKFSLLFLPWKHTQAIPNETTFASSRVSPGTPLLITVCQIFAPVHLSSSRQPSKSPFESLLTRLSHEMRQIWDSSSYPPRQTITFNLLSLYFPGTFRQRTFICCPDVFSSFVSFSIRSVKVATAVVAISTTGLRIFSLWDKLSSAFFTPPAMKYISQPMVLHFGIGK